MDSVFFNYRANLYPNYIKDGNHQQYIRPIADKVCIGHGVDIGCNRDEWAVTEDCHTVDMEFDAPWNDAYNIPVDDEEYDFVFSSHCLEHLGDYVSALEEWTRVLKPGGVMLLYLPHRAMEYWLPQNNRKHMRTLDGTEVSDILYELGYSNVDYTGRDLAYSFAVLAQKNSFE